MEGTLNGLVTMMWILLLAGVLGMYLVAFLVLQRLQMIGVKDENQTSKLNEIQTEKQALPASSEVELGIVNEIKAPIEIVNQRAIVSNQERSIFGNSFEN